MGWLKEQVYKHPSTKAGDKYLGNISSGSLKDRLLGSDDASKSNRFQRELLSGGFNEWNRKWAGKDNIHDDLLFGKKSDDIKKDPIADEIRRIQLEGIKSQEQGLGDTISASKLVDPRAQAGKELGRQERKALMGATNERQNLQRSIANRGLGRTAMAASADAEIGRGLADKIGQYRGQRPSLERKIESNKYDRYLSAGEQVMKSQDAPIQMRDVAGKRQGGIADMIGGAAGGGK